MDNVKSQQTRGIFSLIIVLVLFIGIGAGVVIASGLGLIPHLQATETSGAATVQPSSFLINTQESFRNLVTAIKPAVVSIEAESSKSVQYQDPFENFFNFPHPFLGPNQQDPGGGTQQYQIPQLSSGSGFIVDPDGYILTNNHVVSGAEKVRVVLDDGRQAQATVIGVDPETDVAVLKIDLGEKLPYLEFGDSDALQVGDWVMAAGNPFGTLAGTITVGIVSAKNRESLHLPGGLYYENFIQTDAAINLGNSGGPLVDIYGKVVGINTAITAQGSGIGFTIPINLAKFVYENLRNNGEVIRGWIGVTIQNLDPDLAANLGLKTTNGAMVAEVHPGDPAYEAGLREGDVILKVAGENVTSTQTASRLIASLPVGKPSNFLIFRDGKEMTITVTPIKRGEGSMKLGSIPGTQPNQKPENAPGSVSSYLGIEVTDITPAARQQAGIPDDIKGVIITKVTPGSVGFEKGLQAGDVIAAVNRTDIANVDDYSRLMDEAHKKWVSDKQTVLLRVYTVSSDGQSFKRFLAVPFE